MYLRPNCIFNVIVEWYNLLMKKSLCITVSRILLFLHFLHGLLKIMHFFPQIHAYNAIVIRCKRVPLFLIIYMEVSFFFF